MVDVTQTFLKEVDEALHEERVLNIWRVYKVYIIGALVAALLATVGWQVWQGMERRAAESVATRWDSLGSLSADARNVVLNDVAAQGSVGFRSLARAELAKQALDAMPADVASAAGHFEAIMTDADAPAWLTEAARFHHGLVLMGTDAAVARADFQTLSDGDGPYKAPAMELLATLAVNDGDTPEARKLTQRILEIPNLPADMRQRAAVRLGALSTLSK